MSEICRVIKNKLYSVRKLRATPNARSFYLFISSTIVSINSFTPSFFVAEVDITTLSVERPFNTSRAFNFSWLALFLDSLSDLFKSIIKGMSDVHNNYQRL